MNINNIFGGLLGFIMSLSFLYLFWTPVNSFIEGIGASSYELKIFLYTSWAVFCIIVGLIAPLNLATSDDEGKQ
jgi:hypothetical protein